MNLPLDRIARSSRTWTFASALALAVLALPTTRCHAQYFGGGYGFPGMGYGYGSPGMGYGGYGLGYPGMGYGGFGYGGYGYGGYGLGSGFPSFGYGYAGATGGLPFGGPNVASYYNPLIGYGFNYGMSTPMLGVGLTPLGVSSALTERYMLGRGVPGYSSSYGTVRYRLPTNFGAAPASGTVVAPASGTVVTPASGTVVTPGTGTGVNRR